MNRWECLLLGLALGSLAMAFVMSWFVIASRNQCARVAKSARQERDAMVKEVQRILSERRSQCMNAYTNGFAAGVETRRAGYLAGAVDALVGAATYEEPKR